MMLLSPYPSIRLFHPSKLLPPFLTFMDRNSDWIDIGGDQIKSIGDFPQLLVPNAYAIRASLHGVRADQAAALKERFNSLVDDMDNISARCVRGEEGVSGRQGPQIGLKN